MGFMYKAHSMNFNQNNFKYSRRACLHFTKVQSFSDELVSMLRKKHATNVKLQNAINESTQAYVRKKETALAKQSDDEKITPKTGSTQAYVRMNEKPVTVDRNIDLKDMKLEDIIRTFPKHEVALNEFFRNHVKLPDHRYVPHLPFLSILDELLQERQKVEMYLKIRAELDRDSVDHITSNVRYLLPIYSPIESVSHLLLVLLLYVCFFFHFQYENLFWKGLLPEWALLIFMEKFSLNRSDAIQQLTAQARTKDSQKYPFDLDL